MLKIGPLAVLSAENKPHFTKSFEILQPMMMEDEEMIKLKMTMTMMMRSLYIEIRIQYGEINYTREAETDRWD